MKVWDRRERSGRVESDSVGGKWSASATSALVEGKYTAQATQVSSLENGLGASETVEFEVVTKPPVVVLTGLPAVRSKTDETDVLGDGGRTGDGDGACP